MTRNSNLDKNKSAKRVRVTFVICNFIFFISLDMVIDEATKYEMRKGLHIPSITISKSILVGLAVKSGFLLNH